MRIRFCWLLILNLVLFLSGACNIVTKSKEHVGGRLLIWHSFEGKEAETLFSPVALLTQDPQPCFASKKAKKQYYDAILFSRIRELKCST